MNEVEKTRILNGKDRDRTVERIELLEEIIEEKDKEIERLTNIINELEKWLKEEQVNSVDLDEWTIIQVRDKILELRGDSNV